MGSATGPDPGPDQLSDEGSWRSPGSGGSERWWGSARMVSVAALSLGAVVFAICTAAAVAREWGQPAYAIPAAVAAVAAACAALTVFGVVSALRRREIGRAWLTTLTTFLFLWGYLALFSIGLLLMVAAVVCLVMRIRLAERRPRTGRRWRLGAGLILSLGLAPLTALAINGPVVACTSDGVSVGTPLWMVIGAGGESGMSAGSSSAASGTSEEQSWGTVTVGGTTYAYSCTGSHLTRFIAR